MFITGASGFVGGAAAKYFVSKGHEVHAMSRSGESDQKIIQAGAVSVRCELGNVDPALLQDCSIVLHAAAHVESFGQKAVFRQINVEGTKQLLDAAERAGVKKFIHMSTESVLWYGQDIINADETYPYASSTPFLYSETKRDAEKLAISRNRPGVFETIILRPRLIWGPGDKTIFPRALKMYEQGKFMWIDQGKYQTSTTHIFNLLHGIDQSIKNAAGGEIYFITDDEISTINSFFTNLFLTKNISLKASSIPKWMARGMAFPLEQFWKMAGFRSHPPVSYQAVCFFSSHCTLKNDKAKLKLGYKPVISVREGFDLLRAQNDKQ